MGMYGSNKAAAAARQQELERQARIEQGSEAIDKTFATFTPEFYDQRKDAYEQYAIPQMEKDFSRTNKQLAYQLASRGLLNSSIGNEYRSDLDREKQQTTREIADAAITESNALRSEVEGQRSSLVAQLQASGDPDTTAKLTAAAVEGLRNPDPFTPLGTFFNDWSGIYLGNKVAREYDNNVQPLFSFGNPSGGSSSRIVKG